MNGHPSNPGTSNPTLGAIMIFAKDLPRLRDFYCDALGFVPVSGQPDPSEFLELQPAGQTTGRIALHKIPDAIARDIEITDPPRRRGDVALKFVLYAREPELVHQALEAKGVEAGPVQQWGAKRFFDAVDPEGNVFQVSTG